MGLLAVFAVVFGAGGPWPSARSIDENEEMAVHEHIGRRAPAATPHAPGTGATPRRSASSPSSGIAWLLAVRLLLLAGGREPGRVGADPLHPRPPAWLAYLAFIVTAVASALYLFRKQHSLAWDRLAGASAEIGVLFMGITLVTGMLWGRLTWGVFWRVGRAAHHHRVPVRHVRRLSRRAPPRRHAPTSGRRRSAVLALLAVLEIPLVHFSVELWRSLHQEATVAESERRREDGRPDAVHLFVGIVAFTLLYVWLVIHRQRTLMAIEDLLDDAGSRRRARRAAPPRRCRQPDVPSDVTEPA